MIRMPPHGSSGTESSRRLAGRFGRALFLLAMLGLFAPGCGETGPDDRNDAPELLGMTIENGEPVALQRDVTVTISASDDKGVVGVQVAENESFSGSTWIAFVDHLGVQLSSGDGWKKLFVRVRDEEGEISSQLSGQIFLAEEGPVALLRPVGGGAPDTHVLELRIVGAEELVSAVFTLSFDPAKLHVTGIEVESLTDHILRPAGANLVIANEDYDNTAGEILIGVLAQQDGFTGVTGSGPFARITFQKDPSTTPPAFVEFVEGDWTKMYCYEAGAAPQAVDPAYYLDGEVE